MWTLPLLFLSITNVSGDEGDFAVADREQPSPSHDRNCPREVRNWNSDSVTLHNCRRRNYIISLMPSKKIMIYQSLNASTILKLKIANNISSHNVSCDKLDLSINDWESIITKRVYFQECHVANKQYIWENLISVEYKLLG